MHRHRRGEEGQGRDVEWEVMSERDTRIYSQNQLALFEQKQPQIIIVLCSVGKKN